ncbi:MAG TPA: linear amide C-N hydrolase [Bacteroidales bacterium]|nr:linear amide C-N hydrolase [Bacteroidales bacterium]
MCTSIKLKNKTETVLAQNFDFYYGHGLIITNKRNIAKVAMCDDLTEENMYSDRNSGAKWVSKYGSVTFNQFGRELPTCGINEAGLSVVSMWHDTDQKINIAGEKNLISELQWIQMQLDKFSSIQEVKEGMENYSFSVSIHPMHYHLSDKTGESAIFELENGKLQIFQNKDIVACGNAGITQSLEYSQKHCIQKPADIKIVDPILDRASKAIALTKEFNSTDSSADIRSQAFKILDLVSLQLGFKTLFRWIGKGIPPSQTFLQIVFDISGMKLFFRSTKKKYSQIKSIDICDIDFSPLKPVMVYDIEQSETGNITDRMTTYSREINQRIVEKSFKPVRKIFPPEEQKELTRYPELLSIVED